MQERQDGERLWTPDDCAEYFGIARWTFVNRLSKRPDFPKPTVEISRRCRRWSADAIREYSTRSGRIRRARH